VYAQDEKQDEKPARQEEPKPQPKQDEAKPANRDDAKPAKEEKQEKQDMKRDQEQSRDQMKPEQAEHARPAGKSGHIPDDKFRAHFGQTHHFSARTVIVQGQPRFQYGGYTFEFVDAWPAGWGYTDDCYIDYVDGEYFLFDVLHPGVRIAVTVVL
jgi:hypothetical protein